MVSTKQAAGHADFDLGALFSESSALGEASNELAAPADLFRRVSDTPALLQRIHPDSTYERDASARSSLEYWRGQSTERIVDSLRPGDKSNSLAVGPDGRIFQGNTSVKVLQERGYDVNSLPRTPYISAPIGPTLGPRGVGGSGGLPTLLPKF